MKGSQSVRDPSKKGSRRAIQYCVMLQGNNLCYHELTTASKFQHAKQNLLQRCITPPCHSETM